MEEAFVSSLLRIVEVCFLFLHNLEKKNYFILFYFYKKAGCCIQLYSNHQMAVSNGERQVFSNSVDVLMRTALMLGVLHDCSSTGLEDPTMKYVGAARCIGP